MQPLAIILLEYLEPEWQQTFDCVKATGLPYFIAKRDGVGNMSRAFNEAYDKHVKGKYNAVWMVTNVVFEKHVPNLLFFDMVERGCYAIHPAMRGSDHTHQIPDGTGAIRSVPFIELTAPMFRCDFFEQYMLCEETPYWYMDLIISYQLRKHGHVAVHHGCEVSHQYLRHNYSDHPITRIRKKLRGYWKQPSINYLVKTYGENWKELLWHKHAVE